MLIRSEYLLASLTPFSVSLGCLTSVLSISISFSSEVIIRLMVYFSSPSVFASPVTEQPLSAACKKQSNTLNRKISGELGIFVIPHFIIKSAFGFLCIFVYFTNQNTKNINRGD